MNTKSVTKDNTIAVVNMRIAGEVRAWVARRGLTQGWLAEVLGISQSVVSKRLRGVLPFSAAELFIIASALGLSLVELLGDDLVNEKNPHLVGEGSNRVAGGGFEPPTSGL